MCDVMIFWLVSFLLLARTAAELGFAGIAGTAAGIALTLPLVLAFQALAKPTRKGTTQPNRTPRPKKSRTQVVGEMGLEPTTRNSHIRA